MNAAAPPDAPLPDFVRRGAAVRDLKSLLAQRDSSFEARVSKTAMLLRSGLHKILSTETRLDLSWEETRRTTIRLATLDGLPVELERLFSEESDTTVWRLLLNQSQIVASVEVASLFQTNGEGIQRWLGLEASSQRDNQIESVSRLFQNTLNKLEQHPLARAFQRIDQDILGKYDPDKHEVQIYWMPIALLSSHLNVSVETLTVITVAHEYAHAYTHAGMDLDGHSWTNEGFKRSDRIVTEGLAQHYTELALQKLADRYPDALGVFAQLGERQSEVYKKYRSWLNPQDHNREIMRRVLVDARRKDVFTISDFSASIQLHREKIGGRRRVTDPLPLRDTEAANES